jgi:protein N-terminal asparagine amidohydrolase
MVIQTSDSCSTLVSLDRNPKVVEASDTSNNEDQYVRTALHHASDDLDTPGLGLMSVYLPKSGRVDDCLKHVPQVVETCDELLANPPRYFDEKSSERILYVGQGEVAHSVPSQCDVIVSDKATTCHILGLRSESSSRLPLTSMAHLDGTSYESSIRAMFQEHREHHHTSDEKIDMNIYIVGGFDDMDSTSTGISNWLLNLLARIAEEEKDSMIATLKVCAVSSLNDNGYACPIGRGLGINLRTGHAFLAKVDESAAGPATRLRSARLFTGSGKLSLIHGSKSNELIIEPFNYQPFGEIDQLLQLPDQIMLQYMSTSPDVEEPCFCSSLRATLRFVLDVKSSTMFGSFVDQPLIYKRTGSNTWGRPR